MKKTPILVILAGILYFATALIVMVDILSRPPGTWMVPNEPWEILPYLLWLWLGIALARNKRLAVRVAIFSFPIAWIVQLLGLGTSRVANLFFGIACVPFHHLAFFVLRWFGDLTLPVTYPTFFFLAGYALHLGILAPPLLRRRGFASWMVDLNAWFARERKGAKPEPKPKSEPRQGKKPLPKPEKRKPSVPAFSLPSEALLYEKNAFRLLGLATTESLPAIARRANDTLRRLVQDLPLGYEVAPLPQSAPITLQDVREAYSRLQRGRRRLVEELYWFHLADDHDKHAYALFEKGDHAAARVAWQSLADGPARTTASGRAVHNLAVMEHALAIGTTKTPARHGSDLNGWGNAMFLWKRVCSEDGCWDYLVTRAREMNDSGINPGVIRHLRLEVPKTILGINLAIARAASAVKGMELASEHLKVVGESGFAPKVLKEAFCATFQNDLEELNQYCNQIQASLPGADPLEVCDRALASAEQLSQIAEAIRTADCVSEKLLPLVSAIRSRIRSITAAKEGIAYATRVELGEEANSLIGHLNALGGQVPQDPVMRAVLRDQIKQVVRRIIEELQSAKRQRGRLGKVIQDAGHAIERGRALLRRARKLASTADLRTEVDADIKKLDEILRGLNDAASSFDGWVDQELNKMRSLIVRL